MIDKYETENSIYYIDLENRRYMRRPIWERTPHSPRLEYAVWHLLADRVDAVELVMLEGYSAPETMLPSLRIMHAESVHGIVTSRVFRHSQVESVDE